MESHDELLEHARTVLKRARRHPDPAALVKMKSAIDDALTVPERSNVGLRWLFAGAAMAACAAAIFLVQRDDSPRVEVVSGQAIRSDRTFALSTGTVLQVGRARVQASRDTQIELPALRADEMRLDLFDGEIELDVEPASEALVVSTPLAEIRVIGTRFSVTAGEHRTEVRVSKGEVEVHERATGRIVRVSAGQRHTVERASEVAELKEPNQVEARAIETPAEERVRPLPHPRRSVQRRAKPREIAREPGDRKRSDSDAMFGPSGSAAKRDTAESSGMRDSRAATVDQRAGIDVKRDPEAIRPRDDGSAASHATPRESGDAKRDPTPAIPLPPPAPPPNDARRSTLDSELEEREAPEKAPEKALEPIEALVKRADRARRAGEAKAAAELYAEIADHPEGAAFAEEALFRKAELLRRLDRAQDALQALAEAERRFGRGELAPERSALAARIHLDAGDPKTAARALSGVPSDRATLEVAIVALDTARALEEDHPCDAIRLLSLVHRPAELRARADDLAKRVGSRCTKSP